LLALLPSAGYASIRGSLQLPTEKNPAAIIQWSTAVNIIIGPYQSVVNVGLACAQASIDEKTFAWSNRFIRHVIGTVNNNDKRSLTDLRDNYRRQLQNDFNDGNTCRINGYILSRTEAYIYHCLATIETSEMLIDKKMARID
jgi:hypothetical protein